MKAKLIYNLPDDQFEFDVAVKAVKLWLSLSDVKDELRAILKYEELKDNQYEIVERIQEKFFEILQENEINLNQ